jgi:hypothetical protein
MCAISPSISGNFIYPILSGLAASIKYILAISMEIFTRAIQCYPSRSVQETSPLAFYSYQ